MLTTARMRAEAEDLYGMKLGEIGAATDRIGGGFSRDDGASVKKVREEGKSLRGGKPSANRSAGIRWSADGDGRGS